MPEPVRTTVLVLIGIGYLLCLLGIVTPFWGLGVMTKQDKVKGVVENLMNSWDEADYVRASVWNSHEWWPETSATATGVKGSGTLPEAKVPAILALIIGVVALVLQAVYTFRRDCSFSKIWAVATGCAQITTGVLSSITCCVMAGCLTNKMAASPLFRLGDSFILTVIGSILYGVCGMFTLFHFVYSIKELALDKKILLLYPEVVPQEPAYGAGMPEEAFPTSTSIAGHLPGPSQEFPA